MPTNPLDAKLKKITDLIQTAVTFYYQAAGDDRLRRMIINIVEKKLIETVAEVRKVMMEPMGCPHGMVEGRDGKCIPR